MAKLGFGVCGGGGKLEEEEEDGEGGELGRTEMMGGIEEEEEEDEDRGPSPPPLTLSCQFAAFVDMARVWEERREGREGGTLLLGHRPNLNLSPKKTRFELYGLFLQL